MDPQLATQVEAYLLAARRWVPAAELCERFGVKERALRALRNRPGLCSHCAISGDAGFRHVAHATDKEFARAYARMRQHGLAELVHARRLRRRRHQAVQGRPPTVFERATGQGLLIV